MRHWLEADNAALAGYFMEQGQPAFRASQFRNWLHAQRADTFDAMKNLPASLRARLARDGMLRRLALMEQRRSEDGLTEKWLYRAGAGDKESVECVLIVEKHRRRRTACVSCMAGCPLGCVFCATGRHGFVRNLTGGEIIEQAYAIDDALRTGGTDGLSHVVFMGMGEPLLNLDAVLTAADAFADASGMGLSGRRITISTAGIPEGIDRLAAGGRNYRLALSLHAPNQKIRERIMPAARRWPLAALFPALERFAASSSRDITFEYCLIDGVNAGEAEARELLRLIGGFRAKVNLIPMNPAPGTPLSAPPAAAVRRFQEILENAGVSAPLRTKKGADIGGACGQLRAERLDGG